jgi:hypothetical protein
MATLMGKQFLSVIAQRSSIIPFNPENLNCSGSSWNRPQPEPDLSDFRYTRIMKLPANLASPNTAAPTAIQALMATRMSTDTAEHHLTATAAHTVVATPSADPPIAWLPWEQD